MDKRLFLAISLSLLVLITWSTWMGKRYHIENKEVIAKKIPDFSLSSEEIGPAYPQRELPATSATTFSFSQENYTLNFLETEGAVKEVVFKKYQDYKFPLRLGFWLKDTSLKFKPTRTTDQEITFLAQDQEKEVVKRFYFSNSNYTIELEIEIKNLSSLPLKVSLPLVVGYLDFSRNNPEARFQDVTLASKEKILHLPGQRLTEQEITFLALRDRYFTLVIEPSREKFSGYIKKIDPLTSEVGLISPQLEIPVEQFLVQKFRIYLGPQDLKLIASAKPAWESVVYFGIFDFIARILLQTLEILNKFTHNWGLTLILLSLIIYLLLFPLSLKQMRSMKQMQVLQPKIEALRQLYKDNPQKLNKEIMGLYRSHKLNPFSGCLPLVLQMPIFFALYQVLMRSVALKGAPFWWIKDLSEPDRLFLLPFNLPFFGNEINLLPLLMTAGMFLQQKISLVQASGGAAEQQKFMLVFFPLMFGLIFYRMPAGLVLYWFINSTLMLVYQFKITHTKCQKS